MKTEREDSGERTTLVFGRQTSGDEGGIALSRESVINGRYRVIEQVGDGGMGIVLRVHDHRLERDVALKIIRPRLARDREVVGQFLDEAQAMAQIRHPNVLEIFDFGYHEGLPYFAMQLIDGPDLERWVTEQSQPLHIDVALGIIDQICEGVTAIHDAGVIHRDVKPENILVDHGLRVLVTDFGLVRPVDGVSGQRGGQCTGGTASYMAPELARGPSHGVTSRVDVYALGMITYWLLVGQHPFSARDREAMLEHQLNSPVPRPSDMRLDLPRAFDPVIMSALCKDPRKRTPSARVLGRWFRDVRQRLRRTKSRVLIADENQVDLEWMRGALAETLPDVEVICVPGSHRALEVIGSHAPTLVVVGLENRSINGLELAATMRGDPTTRAVPIVVVSSVGGASDWQVLRRIGVQGFLLKPLVRSSFVSQVRGLLRTTGSFGGRLGPLPTAR